MLNRKNFEIIFILEEKELFLCDFSCSFPKMIKAEITQQINTNENPHNLLIEYTANPNPCS